jgi:putative transposase
VPVKRAYKFRAYPTHPQEARAAQLTQIRAGDKHGQGRHSFTAQQQTLRRLNVVFQGFYDRCRSGQVPGYPRFKPYGRFSQVMFVNGDGAKWNPAPSGGRWARASFQAIGAVKVRQHRCVRGTVKTVQLKREHRRWYVIVVADCTPLPQSPTGRLVGVDLGVARFLTTSDGEIIANPKVLAASINLIADLERRRARTRSGSGNRKRLRHRLAREWRKVRNRRRDFHHKTAHRLASEYDAIALEQLKTANLTRRPKPKPDHARADAYQPNGATAKAGLNRSVLDVGWAQFTRILVGKAEEAGRRVIWVNPAGTSIDCHQCGRRCIRSRQDTVICPVHGSMDADVNGARNIYARAGLGSGQAAHAA